MVRPEVFTQAPQAADRPDGPGALLGPSVPGGRCGTYGRAGAGVRACSFHEKVFLSRPPWRPIDPRSPTRFHPHSGGRAWRPVHVAIRLGAAI
jgi:hypothetical protein